MWGEHTMDEQELATLVNLMMESILADSALVSDIRDAQIVIRPIYTWPDGEPALWIMINCPN
jgi:hypothetical protein